MKCFLILLLISNLKIVQNFSIDSNTGESRNINAFDFAVPEGLYDDFEDDQEVTVGDGLGLKKRARFLGSHAHSALFDILKISPNENYVTHGVSDLFDFLRDSYPLPAGFSGPLQEYDFVVVGAGAAGCVLASRLSEGGRWTVLLLEAGGAESIVNQVPIITAHLQHTDYTWGYLTERQEGVCLGMDDQRCHWPRGKAIGGTSSINYMIYTRGNKEDWDRVAKAGNPGWSYEEVLPYYLKSERANLRGLENSPFHNRNGLLSVEDVRYRTPHVETFLQAAMELGHEIVDYNQENEFGFGPIQATQLNGRRHSASKAFLYPFRNRRNLHILPYSRVTKVNINPVTKTAESVEYVRNRMRYSVRARNEIILSAGPIASPQLLMLSGIGPKEHLAEIGVPIINNLQVGQNIFDHISFIGQIYETNMSIGLTETKLLKLSNILQWKKYGRGPLTLPGGVEALGYIKTKISDEMGNYPDVELIFAAASIVSDKSSTIRKGMKISDAFFNEVYGSMIEKDTFTIAPMLVHPKSRGFMKLKDKNPYHWPRIYYDYFSDPRDLATMVEAIKYINRLTETNAFQKIGARLYTKHFPTCKQFSFGSDEYWGCAIRTLSTTFHHQVGSCKMGPSSDAEAIVDHELKVHGISKLRVVDSSIIPKPPTAHTNAPAIMIGEKAADLIKSVWQYK